MNSSDKVSLQPNIPASLNPSVAAGAILKDLRILVIDDCPENQFLFSSLLSRRGAEVSLANDGEEGVQLALNNSFDIVMMDIHMPIMDGYMAMEALQKANYQVPVIAVTASLHSDDKLKISNAGFIDQAAKPLDTNRLLQIIQQSVSKETIRE